MKNMGPFGAALAMFLFFLMILFGAMSAPAADKFKIEVGPNFIGHRTTFEYPSNQGDWFVSGTSFSGTGLHGSGSVKLSNVVSIGARFDHNFLSNPTFLEITKKGERSEPNYGERRGSSQRAEAFVGFAVPKVGTFEAGVARHYFGRHWMWTCVDGPCSEEVNSYHNAISWGPTIGLTREIELGSFIFGGGVWGYPRMSQSQEWSNDEGGMWRERNETASGIRFEAMGGYKLTSHMAVKGGYQFFRTFTPDPYQFSGPGWRINTVRTEHAIIARYVITF